MDSRALEQLLGGPGGAERVALLDADGEVLAAAPARAGAVLAAAARSALAIVDADSAAVPAERVEVHLDRGSLVVVRAGGRCAVATTLPDPVTALLAHDLRTLLLAAGPRRRRGSKAAARA
ncbi:MAG TPA: hypothetical protein VFB26_07860 [Gaiellaceae bacterium]|nr:hypothetical protein [Gaiellaceae bacterium]